MVGGEEWQEKVYDREEWKKLLRTARNHRILHMPMEWNEFIKEVNFKVSITEMYLQILWEGVADPLRFVEQTLKTAVIQHLLWMCYMGNVRGLEL